MLGRSHYYNKTIRKMVVAFGTLFNDLYLHRYDKQGKESERFKIPLAYGPKEKFITRLQSDPNLTKSINIAVPRMSFAMSGLSYDGTRKRISTQTLSSNRNATTGVVSMRSPIPYDFSFDLSIYVRNIEDGAQLIEQIVPYFTPDFTITVDFVPGLGQKFDIPIILNSIDQNIEYEGNFDDTRLITWNLSFTVKGYLYPSVNTATKIIKKATSVIKMETEKQDTQKVEVYFPPDGDANGSFILNETLYISNKNITGNMIYIANTIINNIMTIDSLDQLLEVGDSIRGLTSNANTTIKQVFVDPYINALKITTTPDPITAQKTDYFTYDETIFEWPNA